MVDFKKASASDSPVASLLPDEMIAGGLADDFDGIVRMARYAPFDYLGTIDQPVLSSLLKVMTPANLLVLIANGLMGCVVVSELIRFAMTLALLRARR